MKQKYSILAASLLAMASSQAAVTLYAEYHLGETGSLGANNIPQDSSPNAKHLTGHVGGGSTAVATTGVSAPGSTHYLNTAVTSNANEGFFGGPTTYTAAPALPTNNFAFGIYVRVASNSAATQGEIFTLGNLVNNTYKISLGSSGWVASSQNIGFIGNAATVSNNTWAHLAVIRSEGQSAFYVNGVQLGGTLANAPTIGQPHLSINPGNVGSAFDGHIDEARIVTFTSGETTTNILNGLQGIPEPSSALLGGLGMLALLRRRRN